MMNLQRRLAAEGIGTAMLLAAIVGSGIMGERLAGGNVAMALLANTIATGSTLVALIFTFGPISGAHFNPAVTIDDGDGRGALQSLRRRRRGRALSAVTARRHGRSGTDEYQLVRPGSDPGAPSRCHWITAKSFLRSAHGERRP